MSILPLQMQGLAQAYVDVADIAVHGWPEGHFA
jgi:hypothetical protein